MDPSFFLRWVVKARRKSVSADSEESFTAATATKTTMVPLESHQNRPFLLLVVLGNDVAVALRVVR
jgi:hypothetical protein